MTLPASPFPGLRPCLMVLAAFLLTAASTASTSYTIDGAGSAVSAKVNFLGIGSKTAGFPAVSGKVRLTPTQPNRIELDVILDARALTAPDGLTRERLKSNKFFWVEKHPIVRFRGDSLTMRSAIAGTVTGTLEARGIAKPVILDVTFDKPPAGLKPTDIVTIRGSTTINRRDFGMNAYSLIVGKTVSIELTARLRPRG